LERDKRSAFSTVTSNLSVESGFPENPGPEFRRSHRHLNIRLPGNQHDGVFTPALSNPPGVPAALPGTTTRKE